MYKTLLKRDDKRKRYLTHIFLTPKLVFLLYYFKVRRTSLKWSQLFENVSIYFVNIYIINKFLFYGRTTAVRGLSKRSCNILRLLSVVFFIPSAFNVKGYRPPPIFLICRRARIRKEAAAVYSAPTPPYFLGKC